MKRLLLSCLALVAAGSLATDYVAARQRIEQLVKMGETVAARQAYISLAAEGVSDAQKADALTQATLLSDRLGDSDRAMELARQIPLPHEAKAAEIELLARHRQWQQIVDRFGNEDLATWPDTLVGNAAFHRGQANKVRRRDDAALADLKLASETLLEDNVLGLALIALGDAYAQFAKDDEQALSCYREVYKRRNVTKRANAAMSAAAILRRRKQFAAALKELAIIPMDQITHPYWRSRMLIAWGAALADAGKKQQAIAKYREALAVKGINKGDRGVCEKALARLEGADQ
jgi:tetratricopeptide (TPR) repeat protein